jgi:hypothetical protein
MIGTGLPEATAISPASAPLPPMSEGTANVAGVMSVQSLASMQSEAAKAASDSALAEQQAQPLIQNVAGLVKSFFMQADQARLQVQEAMLEALYARRGEYTPEKLQAIKDEGQPVIYMMLPSVKMRHAEALLRDILGGSGSSKPWTLAPTPVPDLPAQETQSVRKSVTDELEKVLMAGLEPTLEDVRQRLDAAKVEVTERLREAAVAHAQRMEDKMEDQLLEGGFDEALGQFITDLTTFKTAFLAGPLVRKKPRLEWGPDNTPIVTVESVLEWERVDPFDMYPAPWAKTISDGPLVRRHKLTRQNLTEMIGVEGYSKEAIEKVLELYGTSGLNTWLSVDSQKARAEGKLTTAATQTSGLIDALQYWGSVSGKMLVEWGMEKSQVPDPAKEYQVEVWVIGAYTIKAVLNADPLARRPFYACSYENVPGSVWGNSVYDLMRDCADMCNAAARALAANLGISSGPQIVVNIDRVPAGEDLSRMYPWKMHQVTSDPMGSTAKAIDFFQPSSNAAELMGVFARFSDLADEYTGIPKYTVGQESTGGAGRTASGMSMMLGNASKIIRSVVASIDTRVFTPLLERLFYFNMRYADDPDLKGDVRVLARGALSMSVRESAQVRRNEFLAATNNPVDLQIMGLEGRAELLRAAASTLDMNTSKIVPPAAVLKDRQRQTQQAQAAAAPEQAGQPAPPGPQSPPASPGPSSPNQALMAEGGAPGEPITDHFQPA